MNSTSLKMSIYDLIKRRGIVRVQEIRELAADLGFLHSHAERKCREMRQAGLIDKINTVKGVVSYYRWLK